MAKTKVKNKEEKSNPNRKGKDAKKTSGTSNVKNKQNAVRGKKTENQKSKKSSNNKQNKNKSKKNTGKKVSYLDKYKKSKLLTNEQERNKEISGFLSSMSANINYDLLVPAKSRIILAVSGGVDSVVMLDAMFQLADKYKYELIVGHFNHKLRGISADDDEKFVQRLAGQYGLKFLSDNGDVKSYAKNYSLSIEQAARILRYNFFERIANTHRAAYVMLAHTADDSAETVLLNLLRGSGLTGLGGIPMQRSLGRKSQIIRPLLKFKKNDLISYARLRKLKWREDETNSLMNFTRNKIRHDLIRKLEKDYNPQIVDTLNRTAYLIRLADDFVKEHLSSYLNNFKWSKKKGLLSINISLFESCNTYIQGEMLKTKLKDKFNLYDLSQTTIERIISLPQLDVGSTIEIGKNIVVLRDRTYLHFYRDKKEKFFEKDIFKQGEFDVGDYIFKLEKVSKRSVKMSDKNNIEFLDYDLVPAVLKIRSWLPGDSFRPLGMTGSMKLSDFLINEKISLIDKKNILVLASKNDIIWVCGLRIDDKFKVSSSTTRFLKVELIKKETNNGK